jgi:ArsR family transcriptional regulator
LSAVEADDLAQLFKALADPVRLRLLSMISSAEDGEICVCYLIEAFDLTAPTISYHLKILRSAGLIYGERRGTWVYYRAVPEVLACLSTLLAGPANRGKGTPDRSALAGVGAPAGTPA